MSIQDLLAFVEPGYRAPQAARPVDFVDDSAVPELRMCHCGKDSAPGRKMCRGCIVSTALRNQARARFTKADKHTLRRNATCLGCPRPALPGDLHCGRRMCREVA